MSLNGHARAASPLRQALRRLARDRSLVLCHHGVGDPGPDEDPLFLQVSPARLRRQLELLADAGFTFTTVEGLMREAGDGPPPPGRVALSFDDGMADNHAVALPLLRELSVPATFYIATGLMGGPNPFMPPDSGARMMNPAELRELSAAGMELGAHTVTHPDMSLLDYDACASEMVRSRDALAEATGVTATTFAYPYGAYNTAAHRAARDVGFEAAVTCNGMGSPEDRYAQPRALIWGKDRMPSFVAKLTGIYHPFFRHPAVRFARVHTRGVRRRGRMVLARHGPG